MPTTPKKHRTTMTRYTMPNLVAANVSNAAAPLQASSLGTIAEYSSTLKSGEFSSAARRRFKLLRTAAKLLPDERVSQCQSSIAPEYRIVEIEVDENQPGAKFHNLVRCESPQCPFCSAARSERDRHELSIALAQARHMGLFPLLVTFTLSHHVNDTLEDLRYGLRNAFDKTFSGRWYSDFKSEWEIVGKITTQEVTYGRNGWHPHLHVLFFCRSEFVHRWQRAMADEIGTRWKEKLGTLGFSANLAHGVDVRTAESDIADYVAKWGREPIERAWGADVELAKANVKRASRGGLTPFQILGAAAGIQADLDAFQLLLGQDRESAKKRAGGLYCEFFRAFKGRARLHWGDMRRILEMDEALYEYDQQNPAPERDVWTMCFFERGPIWNYIRGVKTGVDLRAELLTICATKDAWKLRSWLREHRISGGIPPDAFDRSIRRLEVSNEVMQ